MKHNTQLYPINKLAVSMDMVPGVKVLKGYKPKLKKINNNNEHMYGYGTRG